MTRPTPAQAEYQSQLDERRKHKAIALMRDEPMLSTREIAERTGATIADVMLWEASL